MNTDEAGVVVDVDPGVPEGLPDPQPRLGEELEQRPPGAGVVEQEGELLALERGHGARPPVGFSAASSFATGLSSGQPHGRIYPCQVCLNALPVVIPLQTLLSLRHLARGT